MTKLQVGIVSAIVIAGVATPLVLQHQSQARLREKDSALQQQAERIGQLEAENERLSNALAQARGSAAAPREPSRELLRLRSEVGMLREQTNELGRIRRRNRKLMAEAAQADTNQVTAEEQFTLKQTHAVDAMQALLQAMKSYATNHDGQYPANFEQLAASGVVVPSNFPGHLGLNDFELGPDGAVSSISGHKVVLHLKIPIPKPEGGAVMIEGGFSRDGVPSTDTYSVSP